jgi:hypothetical protein
VAADRLARAPGATFSEVLAELEREEISSRVPIRSQIRLLVPPMPALFPHRFNNNRGIGTFGLGNDNQKTDYVLLSPALFERVTSAGLWRKGAWPGSRPQRWEVYEQLTVEVHAASNHHAIWANID